MTEEKVTKYNPYNSECGESIDISNNISDDKKTGILNKLIQSAKRSLPPKTIFEIREKMGGRFYSEMHKCYYETKHGVCWYYLPDLDEEPLFLNKIGQGIFTKNGNYSLVGRLRT